MALGAFQLYESEVPSSWPPNGHLRVSRAQQFMQKQDGAADPIRGKAGSLRGGGVKLIDLFGVAGAGRRATRGSG